MKNVRSPDKKKGKKKIHIEKEKEINEMKKMSFEEFKDAVVENIKEWLPESYGNAEVWIQEVLKNNHKQMTGLNIRNLDDNISPQIYLEDFYREYEDGMKFSEILSRIAEIRAKTEVEEQFDVDQILNFERCKNRVRPRLINAEWNTELLKNRPHVFVEDLLVVFYIDLGCDENGSMSILIENSLLEVWNITTTELYELALKNQEAFGEGKIMTMNEMMIELITENVIEPDDIEVEEMVDKMLHEDCNMYILTNRRKQFGASMILNKNLMKSLVDKMGTNFFVLPSSIHECILVPADNRMDSSELEEIVQEINETQVDLEDRLSDSVYIYTQEDGIKLVS